MRRPCALSAVWNQISTSGFHTLLSPIAPSLFFRTSMRPDDQFAGGACATLGGPFCTGGIRHCWHADPWWTIMRGRSDGHLV